MKQLFLPFLPLLALHQSSHAQTIATFPGKLTPASPVTTYSYGFTPLVATCTTKYLSLALGPSPTLSYAFQTFTVTNSSPGSGCLAVTLTPNCAEAATRLGVIVLAGTPAFALSATSSLNDFLAIRNAWTSDSGIYPASGLPVSFLTPISGNQTLSLVVTTLNPSTYCSSYTLTVAATATTPLAVAVAAVPAASSYSFFPNPVTDQATFTSPVATTLTVRDTLGRAVQEVRLAGGTQQLSLAALPAGVYSLTDAATHQTTRLVKATN